MNTLERDVCDLEYVEDNARLSALFKGNVEKYIKVYFQNGAGDLLGEWDVTGVFLTSKTNPVVWLSSEGAPNFVVARSFDEFLSVLPYGQGVFVGILEYLERYNRKPKMYSPPSEYFTTSEIQSALEYQSEHHDGHQDLVAFITQSCGIEINKDPLAFFLTQSESFPRFQEWLDVNFPQD